MALDIGGSLRPHRLLFAQDRDCLHRGQRVRHVAEVDAVHQLLGTEPGEQLPQRLALHFGVEVPDRVHDGGRREVEYPLLGSHPPHLRIARQPPPEATHVGLDLLERETSHERRERADGGDT